MSGGSRLLPLFLVALFLTALAGALGSLAGPRAYLPRLLLLGAVLCFLAFLYRGRKEILFLLVRARRVAEPGPATTWLLAAIVLFVGSVVLERVPVRVDATRRSLNSLSLCQPARSRIRAGAHRADRRLPGDESRSRARPRPAGGLSANRRPRPRADGRSRPAAGRGARSWNPPRFHDPRTRRECHGRSR